MLDLPLPITSAATALGLSKSTVVRLMREGELGFVRTSPRRVVVMSSEVERYLKSRLVPARDQVSTHAQPRVGGR